MKKQFLILLLAAFFSLTMGCHMMSGSSLLNFYKTDSEIAMSVQTALTNSHQFEGTPINVHSDHGNITLSGYVKTIRQSDVAADLASKVEGAKLVENNLIVRK